VPYATRQDLRLSEQVLLWLTAYEDNPAIPDEAAITQALEAADARINAFLRQRYPLPFASADPVLTNIAVKLARYWLYSRRPEGPPMPDDIRRDQEDADRDLIALRDGKLSLSVSTSDQTPAAEPGRIVVSAPTPFFGSDLLDRV
jgi:phage gp36-like protein